MSHWSRGTGQFFAALTVGCFLSMAVGARAQQPDEDKKTDEMNTPQQKPEDAKPDTPPSNAIPVAHRNFAVQLLHDFAGDQKSIWTSPKNLQISDLTWLVS